MGEGWWKEKDREKESNKLILNRDETGERRNVAEGIYEERTFRVSTIISLCASWLMQPVGEKAADLRRDRLAIQKNWVARDWERIMASRADDSFRGEARRGAATTTTSSSVHFVGRFKLASDTSWEEARQRSPRACYGSFERNASLPWMSATRRDIIQREEEETNEQLAWNSNRALGGWGYLEANFSYELLENSISTRISQGGQKRGEYNLDWKSKLRALIGGDSERVNLVNSDC